MKFELSVDVVNGVIKTNAAEVLGQLDPALQKYNYVVTPEVYDAAKEDRAALNKLVEQISDERKRTEKAVFGTWEADKKAIMAAEKKIKEYADNLGAGITQLEDEEKSKKDMELEELWYTMSDRPYDLVKKKEWLNKSASLKKIKEDMARLVEGIQMKEMAVESFLPLDPVERQQVIDVFDRTLDPVMAKMEADKIAAAKQAVKASQDAVANNPSAIQQPIQPNIQPMANEAPGIVYNAEFRISGSKEQMNALADYIFANKIKCEVLRKWQS